MYIYVTVGTVEIQGYSVYILCSLSFLSSKFDLPQFLYQVVLGSRCEFSNDMPSPQNEP
jgi:hypothetical protein